MTRAPLILYTKLGTAFHEFMLDVVLERYGYMTVGGQWHEVVTWDLVAEIERFRWELWPARMAGAA